MSNQYWMGFCPSTLIIMADKTLKTVDCLQSGLTARSIVKNESNEWKYCFTLSDDSTHSTSSTIIQIELDSIFEIECAGDENKTILCMTKNHKYDKLVYDAVHSENIEDSDFCSYCGDNCVTDGKVFQSYCGTIDYCSLCVPIIHLAVKS